MTNKKVSRRTFLVSGTVLLAPDDALARKSSLSRLGYKSPNEKLNIAAIGAGGKGASDIEGCSAENIVALCDPDWKNAAETFQKYPKAKQFRDYRKMLDAKGDRCRRHWHARSHPCGGRQVGHGTRDSRLCAKAIDSSDFRSTQTD